MSKAPISILILLSIVIILFGMQEKLENSVEKGATENKVQIILHKQGKQMALDPHIFQEVFVEGERLFATADTTYRLIMTKDRIEKIKKDEIVIEIIYPAVQHGTTRKEMKVYFTTLLIPLTGQFANGTVFFSGIYAQNAGEQAPDYKSLSDRGSIQHVRNCQGLDKIKEALRKTETSTH